MPTTGPGTAGTLARWAVERGADLILAAGGDGTINEVAQGVIGSHVPLGILPGGTANVLGMEMGLGRSLTKAAERVGECEPRRIPVGRVWTDGGARSRYFLLMAGVGLDAQIVYGLNLKLKSRVGKLAYWLSGAATFLSYRLREFTASANGESPAVSFALVSRVRNYGGDFEIAPSVHLLDDDFEAVLFEGATTVRYLPYFTRMVLGKLEGTPGVRIVRTKDLEFTAGAESRVWVQVDGEYAGRLPARVEMVPDALTLLMPPRYVERFTSPGRRP